MIKSGTNLLPRYHPSLVLYSHTVLSLFRYGRNLFHRYRTPVTRGRGISYFIVHLASPKSIPSQRTYRLSPARLSVMVILKSTYFCSAILCSVFFVKPSVCCDNFTLILV